MHEEQYPAKVFEHDDYVIVMPPHSVQRCEERFVDSDLAYAIANDMSKKGIYNFLPTYAKFAVEISQDAVVENGRVISFSYDNTYVFGIGYDIVSNKPSINVCTVWNNFDGPFFHDAGQPLIYTTFDGSHFQYGKIVDGSLLSSKNNKVSIA